MLNKINLSALFFLNKVFLLIKYDALHDLVPYVHLKKREKHSWRTDNFSKFIIPPWVLFTFFKLWKWYQTVQICVNRGICNIRMILHVSLNLQVLRAKFITYYGIRLTIKIHIIQWYQINNQNLTNAQFRLIARSGLISCTAIKNMRQTSQMHKSKLIFRCLCLNGPFPFRTVLRRKTQTEKRNDQRKTKN